MRFYSRFKNNLDTLYKDKDLLERIKQRSKSRISVKDKKLIFKTNKIDLIQLDGNFNNNLMHRLEKDVCQSNVFKMKKNSKKQNNNNVSSLTIVTMKISQMGNNR